MATSDTELVANCATNFNTSEIDVDSNGTSTPVNESLDEYNVPKLEVIDEEKIDKEVNSLVEYASELAICDNEEVSSEGEEMELPLIEPEFEDPLNSSETEISPEIKIVNDEDNDNYSNKDSIEIHEEVQKVDNKVSRTSSISSVEKNNDEPFIRGKPSACVFVASLCSNICDDDLCVSVTNHFSQWGKLSTVKVLRDTSNRPYAFVQYTNESDSKVAIEKGHNTLLDGRNIRCEAAKVNRTLYIIFNENWLKRSVSLKMDQYGEVETLVSSDIQGRINKYSPKNSRFWFVKFVYREDAIRAFADLTDEELIEVEWAQNLEEVARNRQEKPENIPKFDKFSIFIGQIHPNVEENELTERFKRHGEIEYLNLVKKNNHNFAFIKYIKESSAASAVERENHSILHGKTMHVQYRENHNVPKQLQTTTYGIALAPPPINLKRKTITNSNGIMVASNMATEPQIQKSKFNGYSSNNINKRISNTNYSNRKIMNKIDTNINNNKSDKFYKSSTNFNGNIPNNKYSKFKGFQNSVNKRLDYRLPSKPIESPTKIMHRRYDNLNSENNNSRWFDKKFDFRSNSSLGYNNKNISNSNNTNTASPEKISNDMAVTNNAAVPYYYYIPDTEVPSSSNGNGNGIGNVTGTTTGSTNFYNPYPQYYMPNGEYSTGNSRSGGYGLNTYSMYYPSESEFQPLDKK
ncbi:uncharacterized protein RJT21DRAFT_137026 [Scheffersomyces amazonensis]|uniref:uncharacterized protein n=1 Tax=Scheffersomyces amazonensis TaxID=1078765 RepID=UPI00315D8AAC